MKIVQVIPDFGLGGIQKAGCVLAEGLSGLGRETLVLAGEGGPRFREVPGEGVRHQVVAEKTPTALHEAITAFGADVVHIHDANYNEPLIDALAANGDTLVVSTPVFGRPPTSRDTLSKTRTAVVGTYILYRLRHWLGMSLDEALRSGVAFTPVVSFQEADESFSSLDPPEARAGLRQRLGIAADAEVLGRVGRSAPEKWSPLNRELIDRFLTERPRGVWLSVGMPDELGSHGLKQRWGDRFLNFPESSDYGFLMRAYAAMDLQAFFSCYGECFAATICEPAGVGLPTIAGTNPIRDNGQSEQVVDGETGYLVASIEGAMRRVHSLFDAPAELRQLKQSTHDYAHARWTPERISHELVQLYEAWLSHDPMSHPRMRRIAEEAEQFDTGYLPRMLALHANGPLSRLSWRAKFAAVRSWTLFDSVAKLKRMVR